MATNDAWEHWRQMPEIAQTEEYAPVFEVRLKFYNWNDVQTFARLLSVTITEKTKSVWFPQRREKKLNRTYFTTK